MTSENHKTRRTVLRVIGTATVGGSMMTGMASARPGNNGNGNRGNNRSGNQGNNGTSKNDGEDLCWEGRGTDAVDGLAEGALGHFVLTAGGQGHDVTSATLKNKKTGDTYEGEPTGGSTFHFRDVEGPLIPGEVCLDDYSGTLGRNTQIVLSDYTVVGYQVDLIHGEPLEELNGERYTDEDRLLQAYWSGDGLEDGQFHRHYDAYEDCWDWDANFSEVDEDTAIPESISVEDGVATACIAPENCDVDDFALVSYSAATDEFEESELEPQRLYDQDLTGDEDGCFSVAVPPTQ